MTTLDPPVADVHLGHLGGPDPYPLYARLRSAAPVHRTPQGGWLLSRYEDVHLAQVDARFGSGVEGWSGWRAYAESALGGLEGPVARLHRSMFVFMDDAAHARMRGLFRRAFTVRAVERLRAGIEERVDRLLDAAVTSGRMEVMGDLALPLAVAVICDLLGIPEPDRRACQEYADVIRETFGPPPAPDRLPAIEAAVDGSGDYFRGVVARRKDAPGDDLLSVLASGGADGMSPDEIAATAILLFGAGHETTASLIGNGLHALLSHQDQRERLRSRPELLPAAVEEMLRYDAPFQYMRKVTREAVVLSGVEIPAGEMVVPLIGAANRDPARFADPDRLDVTRTGEGHLSFGTGPHHCLGAQLARLEARTAIGALLTRLPDVALVPGGARRPQSGGALRMFAELTVSRSGDTGDAHGTWRRPR